MDCSFFHSAPELLNGVFIPQSDLFSIGALLHHLLFGVAPWYNENILNQPLNKVKNQTSYMKNLKSRKTPNLWLPRSKPTFFCASGRGKTLAPGRISGFAIKKPLFLKRIYTRTLNTVFHNKKHCKNSITFSTFLKQKEHTFWKKNIFQ